MPRTTQPKVCQKVSQALVILSPFQVKVFQNTVPDTHSKNLLDRNHRRTMAPIILSLTKIKVVLSVIPGTDYVKYLPA